jgi:hypothetical protein
MDFLMLFSGARSPVSIQENHDDCGSDTIVAAGAGCAAFVFSELFRACFDVWALGAVPAGSDGGPEA